MCYDACLDTKNVSSLYWQANDAKLINFTQMNISRDDLNKLMRQHGVSVAKVVERTKVLELNNENGFTYNMVWRVLRGEGKDRRFNNDIIKATVDLVAEKKQQAEAYEAKMAELIAAWYYELCISPTNNSKFKTEMNASTKTEPEEFEHQRPALHLEAGIVYPTLFEFLADCFERDYKKVETWGADDYVFPPSCFDDAFLLLRNNPDLKDAQDKGALHVQYLETEDGDPVDGIILTCPRLKIKQELYFYDLETPVVHLEDNGQAKPAAA